MWQILRALLGPEAAMLTMGDGRGDNSGNEMEALQKAYSAARAKRLASQSGGLSSPPAVDVPQGPPAPSAPAPNTDNWGLMGMPSGVPASQGFPNQPQPAPAQAQAPMQVPMPQARPMDAPQASAQPDTSFFMRNALMQQDPNGGGYIDPQGAASVRGPDLIAKMMSYLHNKDMA